MIKKQRNIEIIQFIINKKSLEIVSNFLGAVYFRGF